MKKRKIGSAIVILFFVFFAVQKPALCGNVLSLSNSIKNLNRKTEVANEEVERVKEITLTNPTSENFNHLAVVCEELIEIYYETKKIIESSLEVNKIFILEIENLYDASEKAIAALRDIAFEARQMAVQLHIVEQNKA